MIIFHLFFPINFILNLKLTLKGKYFSKYEILINKYLQKDLSKDSQFKKDKNTLIKRCAIRKGVELSLENKLG